MAGGGMDWGSMLGGMGGGGGGGMQNPAQGLVGISEEINAPYEMRRQRLLSIAPQFIGVGNSIRPIGTSQGGIHMGNAAVDEMTKAQGGYMTDRSSVLDRKIRKANATAKLVSDAVSIVGKIAAMGVAAGAGGGAGGAAGSSSTAAGGTGVVAPAATDAVGGANLGSALSQQPGSGVLASGWEMTPSGEGIYTNASGGALGNSGYINAPQSGGFMDKIGGYMDRYNRLRRQFGGGGGGGATDDGKPSYLIGYGY